MPIYMLEGSYTAESWAPQLKNPQNRVELVGKALCESAGGKLIGAWYCFGDHDLVLVADMPNNQSMSALSLAVTAGGAVKSLKTTGFVKGEEAVTAMKKANSVTYTPAR